MPEAAAVELDHDPPSPLRGGPRGWRPPRTHTATLARLLRPRAERVRPQVPPASPQPFAPSVAQPAAQPASERDAGFDPVPSKEEEAVPERAFSGAEDPYDDRWPELILVALPGAGSYRQPPAVPEPGTGLLLGVGLVGLAALRRAVRRLEAQSRALRIG